MSEELTTLILAATAASLFGWGVTQILLGLLHPGSDRLMERLMADSGHHPAAAPPSRITDRDGTLPAYLARPLLLRQLALRMQHVLPGVSPARLLGAMAAVAAVSFCVVTAARSLVEGSIAAITVIFATIAVVRHTFRTRQHVLVDQLVDAMDLLARILRAGHSLSTGFRMIGDELPEPIAGEFRRCYEQHSLGRPLDRAMLDMADRVANADFDFFVTSLMIHRQTGGDLAGLLDSTAAVVRSRVRLQQHTRALTADGRVSGDVLTALPPVMFVVLYWVNPGYMGVLVHTRTGQMSLVAAATLVVIGQWMIRRMVTIRV